MPLAPEQQAKIERAAEMLEGYAAHLYKLSPFNPDEHPYIPSIEEAAGEMRALLAQLEAQEARHCPKQTPYGEATCGACMEAQEVATSTDALQELADQAQELGMGYGEACGCAKCKPEDIGRRMILCATCGNKRCPHATDHALACTNSNEPGQPGSSYGPLLSEPVASPPGSTESGDHAMSDAFEILATTCDGNCNPRDLRKLPPDSFEAVNDGDTYVNPLVERDFVVWKAAAAALSQPVPDVVFDGMAVYEEVRRKAGHMRTSPENVSDVLDAAVRLIRAAPGDPAQ